VQLRRRLDLFFACANLGGSSIIAMLEAQAHRIAQVARRLAEGAAHRLAVEWEELREIA
jgi:hypothetical protein